MRLDLATIARAKGIRRKSITIRPIVPTNAQAVDLAQIILPAADMWADAKAQILAAYVLPTQDGLTIDGANDLQAAIDRAAGDFSRLTMSISPALRRWAVRAERLHRMRWVDRVHSALGIDLSTVLIAQPVEETVESFISRMTALVKDISGQAQARISDAVFRGYQDKTPLAKVAKEIDEAVGLGRKRAIRIASDQNSKLSAALDRERREEAGITKYKYRHSGKLHPRQNHKARDGYVYNAATGESTNGGPFIPEDDRAGMKPFCGCREQAYLDIMAELE